MEEVREEEIEPSVKRFKKEVSLNNNSEVNRDDNLKGIKCFYDEGKEDEKELMKKALKGEIISSLIYPLLFDDARDSQDTQDANHSNVKEDSNSSIFYRSLPFLRSLAAGSANYHLLNDSSKHFVHIGLRDLFFASLLNLLNDADKETLLRVTEMVPDSESYVVDGLSISFHPSMNRKVLKYMHVPITTLQNTHSDDYFIQPTAPLLLLSSSSSSKGVETNTRSLRAVFIDPRDLSYHNFESIVRLDSWFQTFDPLQFTTTTPHQINPDFEIFTFNLLSNSSSSPPSSTTSSKPNVDPLHQLDNLDLYTPPLNSSTRGGNRFIFQSHQLSDQLTEAIKSSGVLEMMSPSNHSEDDAHSAENSFVSVNSVFRLNKFVPGDRNFESHLDTPYSDRSHHHFSRYSLLIYLSGGVNPGTLSFEHGKVNLDEINDFTCVVFRQDYEHCGKPFLDSTKIFLRSELIFYIEDDEVLNPNANANAKVGKNKKNKGKEELSPSEETPNNGVRGIRYDNVIGRLFSSAVYFTGQSVYEPELSLYAHKCYELSNKLHWNCQFTKVSATSSISSNLASPSTPATKGKAKGKGKAKAKSPKNSPSEESPFQLQLLHKTIPVSMTLDGGEKSTIIQQQFITCGCDYWFQRQVNPAETKSPILKEGQDEVARDVCENDESFVKECVMYAILDYFNCTLDRSEKKKKTPFRSLCQTKILSLPDAVTIPTFEGYESFVYSTLDATDTTPPNKSKPCLSMNWVSGDELSKIPFIFQKPLPKPNPKYCCPFHFSSYPDDDGDGDWSDINSYRILAKVPELHDYYSSCRAYCELKLRNTSMFCNWLGTDVIFNKDSVVVEGDKVYILNKTTDSNTNTGTSTSIKESYRVNFAACWNGGEQDSYISVAEDISTKRLLIPPILFHSVNVGDKQRVHLMLDFFENNWNVTISDRQIPIPVIQYNDEDSSECFRTEVLSQFYTGKDDVEDSDIDPGVDDDGDRFLNSSYRDCDDSEAGDEEDDDEDDEW